MDTPLQLDLIVRNDAADEVRLSVCSQDIESQERECRQALLDLGRSLSSIDKERDSLERDKTHLKSIIDGKSDDLKAMQKAIIVLQEEQSDLNKRADESEAKLHKCGNAARDARRHRFEEEKMFRELQLATCKKKLEMANETFRLPDSDNQSQAALMKSVIQDEVQMVQMQKLVNKLACISDGAQLDLEKAERDYKCLADQLNGTQHRLRAKENDFNLLNQHQQEHSQLLECNNLQLEKAAALMKSQKEVQMEMKRKLIMIQAIKQLEKLEN